MRTFLLVLVAVIILSAGVVGAAVVLRTPSETPTTTPITFQEDSRAARLKISLKLQSEDGSEVHEFECQASRCIPSIQQEPEYAYQNDAIVRRSGRSGNNETLVTKTPLVTPRGLFLSPNGEKVAYFLDNIHDEKQQLTELWYLDTQTGERRLVAEKLHRPDVLTSPRWNSSSTHLWFMVNSGQKEKQKIELAVAGISPTNFAARFTGVDWPKLQDSFAETVADISFTGRSLALAEKKSDYRADLTIIHEGSEAQTAVVRGQVPFLQWLPDGRLLYAVQDESGVSLWSVRSTMHNFVARLPGRLEAGRADPSGEFIAFIVQEGGARIWSVFQVATGLVFREGLVPDLGEKITITQVALKEPAHTPTATDVSAPLEDAEITAFVEKNLIKISGEATAKPQRIITTSEPNVVYVDYQNSHGENRRLLITIRDAIHPEWSIRARYEPAAGEWRKVQGGGVQDPKPKNIYEWEKSLNQWILKSVSKSIE